MMDETTGQIEGVSRLYQQLNEKITEKGGMGNLFVLRRKMRETLEGISTTELDALLSEIIRAREALHRLQEEIVEIRVLKEVLTSASRMTPTSHQT